MKHDYRFISKKSEDVKTAFNDLNEILRQVHRNLRNLSKKLTFQHKIVGSYSLNMLTYDSKSNIGYDFDINIYPNDENEDFTAKEIKQLFKCELDKIAPNFGYDYAEDSTRVLTIKIKDRKNSRIIHSVDFAFVHDYEDDYGIEHQEYIHFQKKQNNYYWTEQSENFHMLPEKIDWLKRNNLWEKMKELYIYKKNCNDNPYKHSRSLRAEAVNEIYHKYYKP